MKLKRKYKLALLSILGIIIVLVIFIWLKNKDKVQDEEVKNTKETLLATNEKIIEGLIIYQDNENSYLSDNKQIIYMLPRLEYDTGDYIIVNYDGDIDKNKTGQDITIKQIEKTDKVLKLDSLNLDYYDKAKKIVDEMSLEETVGQLYMVHHTINSLEDIKNYYLGGLVLFGEAFKNKTKKEVITMTNSLQENAQIPLFLAVDEEGGTVVRISSNKNLRSSSFLSPRTLYQNGGFDLIKSDNIEKNKLLKSLGININLAPVLDISNDKNDYIYSRSIGLSPELTGEFATTIIESSKETGIVNVLKHYPGYGKNKDTHKSSSIDTRTLEEVEDGLIPFKIAIGAGAEAIMISHNTVTAIDKDNPASISINNHNYLRNTLDFKGMIITDALNMGATADIKDMGIKSILAGNNILITKNFARDIKEIIDNVNNGTLSEYYLKELAIKVIAWKIQMGLVK